MLLMPLGEVRVISRTDDDPAGGVGRAVLDDELVLGGNLFRGGGV